MSFLEKLFGRKSQTKKTAAWIQEEKKLEYDFTTPGLSQTVTFGRNRDGEVAAVVLNRPEENFHKVIVNHSGRFEDFPGIMKGDWTAWIVGNFNFEAGAVRFRTSFERHEDSYRCLWEIQPDGRYWADEDGFGMEDDAEIILYADLDKDGNFKGPFRIYRLDGNRVEEQPEPETEEEKPQAGENAGNEGIASEDHSEQLPDDTTGADDSKSQQNEAGAADSESQTSETADETEKKPPFTYEDKNNLLARECPLKLAESLNTPMVRHGHEGIRFRYYKKDESDESNKEKSILLEVTKDSKDEVTLRIGASRRGTDRLYSNYLFEAGKTQEEVKAWLENSDVCVPVILECAKHLSDSVDEYWD